MSRWRETLCGSVIKSAMPMNEKADILAGQAQPVLSSGGSFLPRSQNPLKARGVPAIFLPKEKYEIIVNDSESKWMRYGHDADGLSDEIERIESALEHLDTKIFK
ncbi:MAG: hypothetical protein Q7T11_03575 [Deltaproteobacteria bacterium]|nr:hypothetical protein [Deltaproteobacteria bacterium]